MSVEECLIEMEWRGMRMQRHYIRKSFLITNGT